MNDAGARAWPTTADGTTDWERVFEDPSDGLIVLACRSETPDQLKTMTLIILRQLFKRKNDDQGDDKMAAYLDKTITDDAPADAIDGLRSDVTRLFRRIKDDRIKQAAAYIEKKGILRFSESFLGSVKRVSTETVLGVNLNPSRTDKRPELRNREVSRVFGASPTHVAIRGGTNCKNHY